MGRQEEEHGPRGRVSKEVFEEQVKRWVYIEGWHAEGWPYRQRITIYNNNDYDLTDFQVRLDLDSTVVGENFNWSRQGADLRFFDEAGNKLPYWVEQWDEVNRQATVWVKVLSIPASGSTDIYMYYGNSEVESESDGNAVFEFFDDFNTLSTNWQDIGQTAWSIIEIINSQLHLKTGTTVGMRLLAYNGYTFTDGIIEARINAVDRAPSVAWRIVDGRNYYKSRINVDKDFVAIDIVKAGSETKLANTNIALAQQYYRYVTRIRGSSFIFELYDDSGNLITSLSASDTTFNSGMVGFWGYGDTSQGPTELYVDWIRVRKYADVEPSAAFSAEEYGLTYTLVPVQVEHIIVEHSGMQEVIILDENDEVIVEFKNLSSIADGEIVTRLDWKNETGKTVRSVIIVSVSGVVNKIYL